MAKTKSERMKAYRARKKAQLGDEWLRRENQRVKSYLIPIAELAERKKEHKRQLNREHAAKYRKKLKLTTDSICEHTPNTSGLIFADSRTSNEDMNAVGTTTGDHCPLTVKLPFTTQSKTRESRGRKRVSRALAKQYRKNETLQDQNEQLKRKLNTAMKRLNRLKNKHTITSAPSTPRSKSDNLLREAGVDPVKAPTLRQKVLFAECVSEEIKQASQSNSQSVVMRVVSGKVIKKYKLKKVLGANTNLNRRKMTNVEKSVEIRKRSRNKAINIKIANDIKSFLEREDNSRLLPGKADAVKVGKEKVQKRVLSDYMYNLHAKFLAESSYNISHSTFCKKKPPSIAHVNFSTRSVCLCQKHQNFALKLRCLKNYKITSITSPDKFMDTYSTEEELGMKLDGINAVTVKYQEWKRKKMKDGKERMRVVDIELPKVEFIQMMKETYREFANHIYKVIEQYKGIKQMKERLPVDHFLVQMDFSENYCCQNMEEVQSAYWNASAVTLHPTVIYKKDNEGNLSHDSIVFVSEVLQHNASMVLAIIEKIVKYIKQSNNHVKAIHFWTDSPTSQYRNKTVFDIISRFETIYDISASWHYFESGHGKGPCDGIGGTTKRNADNAIKQGKAIIQDADDFFKWASETTSQIEYQKITQEEFNHSKNIIDKRNLEIKPLKGTMKIHSVVAVSPENVRTRETVCVCEKCFQTSGFIHNSGCAWEEKCLTKQLKDKGNTVSCSNILQDGAQAIVDDTSESNNDISSVEPRQDRFKKYDYVVIRYDNDKYIGKVVGFDEEDGEIEVTCMEACGKNGDRYKWPRNEDKIWVKGSTVLRQIKEPQATGKSQRMFSIESDLVAFMKA